MKLDLYCAGSCRDNGKSTQVSGCAVIATVSESKEETYIREYGYALGNINNYAADLQSVHLGLMSIGSKFKHLPITIHTINKYIIMILTKSDINVAKNQEIVKELKKWYSSYNNIKVILDDHKHKYMIKARDVSRQAMASQIHYDSHLIKVA